MSASFNNIACPCCGNVFNLEQAWDDADGRRFIELVTKLPPRLIRPYYSYLKLFKPAKQGMRWATALKLTKEIAPLIQAAQVKRNGLTYAVPFEVWEKVLNDLVQNPPDNLQLPLKKHAYLLAILANQAEQVAAKTEKKTEQNKIKKRRESVTEDKPISFKELQKLALQKEQERAAKKPKSKPPENWNPLK